MWGPEWMSSCIRMRSSSDEARYRVLSFIGHGRKGGRSMKPHIEEALLSLRLADRDTKAFKVLSDDPDVHLSVVCFHAQQAVEKSLKAALFAHQIEFGRTHDL